DVTFSLIQRTHNTQIYTLSLHDALPISKITVEIKDKEYTIVGTESKEHVEHVAHLVNEKMNDIHQANKHLDTSKLAVLTAINTMNDFVKLQEEFDELMRLIEEEN